MCQENYEEYTVEICITRVVLAKDSVRAVEQVMDTVTLDDAYIYVDGNLWS